MKIVAVIPARYGSTRLPGKPLKEICGKPMLWWVYQRISIISDFSSIYVATDDERIGEICDLYNIPYVMTKNNHPTGANRLQEVSESINIEELEQLDPAEIDSCSVDINNVFTELMNR